MTTPTQSNDARYATVIKSAYRDIANRKYTQYTIGYADGSGEFVRVPQFELMTGQEWYERFKKKLALKNFKFIDSENHIDTIRMIVEDAARQAAGTEDD